ncbi:MAG: hypothetical protein LBU46_07080, partial [Candidatus Accumulibacter sp.]|nr:hypothetical protein [Accumulibacter sp.]
MKCVVAWTPFGVTAHHHTFAPTAQRLFKPRACSFPVGAHGVRPELPSEPLRAHGVRPYKRGVGW